MKTFYRKDVFSWYNATDARQYIGQSGYFSDYYIENAEEWNYGKLTQIYLDNATNETFCRDDGYSYGLFLPACKVIEVEVKEKKKWRPFKNCKELCQHIHITGEDLYAGLTLYIRNKKNKVVRQVIVTDINYDKPFIGLGVSLFDVENLFIEYEWQDEDNGDWQPFGVEVEE